MGDGIVFIVSDIKHSTNKPETAGFYCYCCCFIFMKTAFPLIINAMHAKHEVLVFHWLEIINLTLQRS